MKIVVIGGTGLIGSKLALGSEVTELFFSKDLTNVPGKEGLMTAVEYSPGHSDPIHRHNAHAFVYAQVTLAKGYHRQLCCQVRQACIGLMGGG